MEREMERAWEAGERFGKGLVWAVELFPVLRVVASVLLLSTGAFSADLSDPACNAAKKIQDVWGLIQVGVTAAVSLVLLIGAVASLMERKGGWAGILFFSSFILGGVTWVVLQAAGKMISDYASSCGSGT